MGFIGSRVHPGIEVFAWLLGVTGAPWMLLEGYSMIKEHTFNDPRIPEFVLRKSLTRGILLPGIGG